MLCSLSGLNTVSNRSFSFNLNHRLIKSLVWLEQIKMFQKCICSFFLINIHSMVRLSVVGGVSLHLRSHQNTLLGSPKPARDHSLCRGCIALASRDRAPLGVRNYFQKCVFWSYYYITIPEQYVVRGNNTYIFENNHYYCKFHLSIY